MRTNPLHSILLFTGLNQRAKKTRSKPKEATFQAVRCNVPLLLGIVVSLGWPDRGWVGGIVRFGGHALFMLLGCCVIITCQDVVESLIYMPAQRATKKNLFLGAT